MRSANACLPVYFKLMMPAKKFFTRRYALIGLGVAGAFVVAFFAFSGNGEVQDSFIVERGTFRQEVSVSGKVIAAEEANLGFSQGGRLESVYGAVGDQAPRGRVLAELENDDVRALLLERRASLLAEEADLTALKEGARVEDIAVSEAAVLSAEVALSQAERALLEEIQDAFRTVDDSIRTSVDQFISNARTAPQLSFATSNSSVRIATETQRSSLEPMLVAWKEEVFALTAESTSVAALENAKENLSVAAAFIATAASAVSQGVPTGSVTQTTLDGYAADVGSARSSVGAAITALTNAETAEKNARASLVSAEKTLALKKAPATNAALLSQTALVDAARAKVLDAEAQLRKTFIVAPFDGVIAAIDVEVGEITAANARVISLISEGAFQIESFIPEINIALVSVGNEAAVTLDAYGSAAQFPARIISIDPAETIRDGVSTYRAILEFAADDPRIRSGMTANVFVTTAVKNDVISIPQGLLQVRDGRRFVTVLEGDTPREREVTVGLVSSLGTIEILSGLSEGEVVVP